MKPVCRRKVVALHSIKILNLPKKLMDSKFLSQNLIGYFILHRTHQNIANDATALNAAISSQNFVSTTLVGLGCTTAKTAFLKGVENCFMPMWLLWKPSQPFDGPWPAHISMKNYICLNVWNISLFWVTKLDCFFFFAFSPKLCF